MMKLMAMVAAVLPAAIGLAGGVRLDVSGETARQTVIAEGGRTLPEGYQGHPTTVLTREGKLICVWTLGHGGPCGPAAESTDGGRTWTRIDDRFPKTYRETHKNCPTLQKCVCRDGHERLFVFSAKRRDPTKMKGGHEQFSWNAPLGIMISDDGGRTWREGTPAEVSSNMPPTGFMQLKDGSLALFGQVRLDAKVKTDGPKDDQGVWMSVSRDDGETWSPMRIVARANERNLCEPFCLRSPDGQTLALLMRENRHRDCSMRCFSSDEGRTWTKPALTAPELTGDRHEGILLDDGRYLICFRDQMKNSPTAGQYVGWVGSWNDIAKARPGDLRIRLLNHHGKHGVWPGNEWDTGYSGVEKLADGTILCTTYTKHFDDGRHSSVVATRLYPSDFGKVPGEPKHSAVPWPKADTAWMAGSVGVSVHWTAALPRAAGPDTTFEEAVNGFDVPRFVDAIASVGARHLIFTTAHAYQMLPMPNAALDAIAPGRTTKRDLFGEILAACAAKGIRVIAYYNHSCNGAPKREEEWLSNGSDYTRRVHEWMKRCRYPFIAGGDAAVFASNYCAIVRDISRRYGTRISGWWFDSPYSVDTRGPGVQAVGSWRKLPDGKGWVGADGHPRAFPWADLVAAAKSGNPRAPVAVNAGCGRHFQYTDLADYCAGEVWRLDKTTFPAVPRPDLIDTRWACVDDINWTFDRKRGFVPLYKSVDFLVNWTREQVAANRMVTFNVLIDRDGNLSPVLKELKPCFDLAIPRRGTPEMCGCATNASVNAAYGRAIGVAWNRLFDKLWSPKTGLLYEHLPDETLGAIERLLPTPAEIAKNEPIATGWNTGMEDGVLNGCPLILAAMLRGDAAALEKLVPGVLTCATVSKVPGFLARSISSVDGVSHYANSSRDQYTLFVYAMWRYAKSRFCPAARRAEIVRIMTDIARYAEKGQCAANGYSLLREDGKIGIVCQMWVRDPKGRIYQNEGGLAGLGGIWAHEAERLPMIYAAAYVLTGDRHWRERELEIADDALRIAEAGTLDSLADFALYQMQVSERLLWECETDPVRRARYLKLLRKGAEASVRNGFKRAEELFAAQKGDLGVPSGDWRTWPTVDDGAAVGGPRDGTFNGLPYRRPVRPTDYQNCCKCVKEIGYAVINPLMCPGYTLDEAYVAHFRDLSVRANFARHMSPSLVYPVLADAMLASSAGTIARADDARRRAGHGGRPSPRFADAVEIGSEGAVCRSDRRRGDGSRDMGPL